MASTGEGDHPPDHRPPALIDGWLGSGARLLERHDVSVAALPDRTYEATLQATFRDMPVARVLFTLRGIPHSRDMTLRQFFSTPPFLILEEDAPREIVFGVAGRLTLPGAGAKGQRRPSTPVELRAYVEDGAMRAIANFRVQATRSGSRLSTETWVESFGARARRLFRAYWFVVGPFSALTRREFLRAARRRAEG